MAEGWRKVILAGGFAAAILFGPMDSIRADVLKVLILATMGANGIEHLAKRLTGKGNNNGKLTTDRGRVHAVRNIGNPTDSDPSAAPANTH